MNTSTLVKQFKNQFESETGIKIDFRKDVFLENQYGATPCFGYDFAERVIASLYDWGHSVIEDNVDNYPKFEGWEYNLPMSCESLRTSTLKSLIESVCSDLYIQHVETYRNEGSKVFKYSKEHDAYIFDHTKR